MPRSPSFCSTNGQMVADKCKIKHRIQSWLAGQPPVLGEYLPGRITLYHTGNPAGIHGHGTARETPLPYPVAIGAPYLPVVGRCGSRFAAAAGLARRARHEKIVAEEIPPQQANNGLAGDPGLMDSKAPGNPTPAMPRHSSRRLPVPLDMSTSFAGITLKNPVMAAAGTFGYGVEFEDIVPSTSSVVSSSKGFRASPWRAIRRQGCLRPRPEC